MTALSTLRTDIRNRLIETTADFFTNAELLTWINDGYREFNRTSEWLERVKAYPLVANQFDYSLPSNILKVDSVWWKDQWKLEPKDVEEFHAHVGSGWPGSGTEPRAYRIWPWSKFRLDIKPSSASASTTVNGAHNTTVTTIAVADASSLPSQGYIILNDSEQVFYYAKSSNNLLQCVRGADGSTAASYTGGESVKYAPLLVYHTYLPSDLSGDSDELAIPDQWDKAIKDYAVSQALFKSDRPDDAKYWKSKAESQFKEALEERTKLHRDRHHNFKDVSGEDWWL